MDGIVRAEAAGKMLWQDGRKRDFTDREGTALRNFTS